MENLSSHSGDFLEEVESIPIMKWFIIGVIVRVGFLEEKRPDLEREVLISMDWVQKNGRELSNFIRLDRDVIIHDDILPHILLENFDQIHPIITHLRTLKHPS